MIELSDLNGLLECLTTLTYQLEGGRKEGREGRREGGREGGTEGRKGRKRRNQGGRRQWVKGKEEGRMKAGRLSIRKLYNL